ncbi:MAG: hypothetical protein WKG07_16435 [Hymenobacter sp.]
MVNSVLLLSLLTLVAACSTQCRPTCPAPAPAPCNLPTLLISYQNDVLPILRQAMHSAATMPPTTKTRPQGLGRDVEHGGCSATQSFSLAANGHNGASVLVGSVRGDAGFVGMPFAGPKSTPAK